VLLSATLLIVVIRFRETGIAAADSGRNAGFDGTRSIVTAFCRVPGLHVQELMKL